MRLIHLSLPALALSALVGCADGPGDGKPGDDAQDTSVVHEDDVTPPTITLSSPLDGETVSDLVDLAATAADDMGLSEVRFEVDGSTVGTATAEPYAVSWDSTSVINGNYTVVATAVDGGGNTASAEADFLVENAGSSASTLRVINPVDDATICGNVTVEVAVSAEGASLVFLLDGLEVAADDDSPYQWEWNTLSTSNGTHTVRALATLPDGSQVQNTITVNVENTGEVCDNLPSVSITTPDSGTYTYGNVPVEAIASDDVGVVEVQFFIDNGLLLADGAVPYGLDWASDDFEEGPHTVKAIAADTTGQTAETQITVTLDRTAPDVVIVTPTGGREEGTVSVEAEVTEAIGLESVTLYIDGVEEEAFSAPPYTYAWDTTTEEWGSHALEFVAVDRAGHRGSDTVDVDVDNPPEVSITNPGVGDTLSGSETVTVDASDDLGVENVTFYLDGVRQSSDSASPFNWAFDTCDTPTGSYVIEAVGSDAAGHEVSDSVTVTVDQALEVVLDAPSGTLGTTETLLAYASDDETITSVVWDLDGTVVATDTRGGTPEAEVCPLDCYGDCEQFSATLDVTTLASGRYTLTVTATDAAGNTATDSNSVTVDWDQDGDGYDGEEWGGDDCDDADAAVSPAAPESCDGLDEDCDGDVDEDFDSDADGYYDATLCAYGTDCDDADASVSPVGSEICDGIDNDCDGAVDISAPVTTDTGTFGVGSSTYTLDDDFYGNVYRPTSDVYLTSFSVYMNPIGSIEADWRVYEATTQTGTYTLVASATSTVSGGADWYDSGDLDLTLTSGRYYLIGVGSPDQSDVEGDTTPSLTADAGLTPIGIIATAGDPTPSSIGTDPSSGDLFEQTISVTVGDPDDIDDDGDGETEFCGDCDDDDATAWSGATELCDGVDNDCSGAPDATEVDADGDDDLACADCDDADPDRSSIAAEACDGVDNDCSGAPDATEVDADGDGAMGCTSCTGTEGVDDTGTYACVTDCDDGDPAVLEYTFYDDDDGDGYGDATQSTTGCTAPAGYSAVSTDCDDADGTIHPGVAETCDGEDEDCDGSVDEDFDADGDGYYDDTLCSSDFGSDCDDGDAGVYPGATEDCNLVDDDCDGVVDADGPATSTGTFADASSYLSNSADFYGNVYTVATTSTLTGFQVYVDSTSTITGYWRVYSSTTQTGTYSLVYGTTSSVSSSAGWHSSPTLSVTLTPGTYYLIGFGTSGTTNAYYDTTPSLTTSGGLTPIGEGYYTGDYDPSSITNDPDTGDLHYQTVTVVSTPTTDTDDDGDGESEFCGDCNDASTAVNTSAVETCDGIDDDCDGSLLATEADADADGYMLCESDCDDAEADTYPSATELCDGVDNNCDGVTSDEADADGDGVRICETCTGGGDTGDTGVSGSEVCTSDCDDSNASITTYTWYVDADGDGYGSSSTLSHECTRPSGYAATSTDCDDARAAANPGAVETCNSADDDCDGTSDEGYDGDGDGSGSCDDCNDASASISPLATETCGDSVDQDCDGFAPLCEESGSVDLSLADAQFTGEDSSDYAGVGISAGDFTGDGYADVVVGAYGEEAGGTSAGAVYVIAGPISASTDLGTASLLKFTGEDASDYAGITVSARGDLDRDGDDDLLIGATGDDDGGSSAGAVYIIVGGTTSDRDLSAANAKINGEDASDALGSAVAIVTDVDGDGYDDALFGASGDDDGGSAAGAAYLQFGPITADLDAAAADVKLVGEDASDAAGAAVAGAGDVDGDGFGDLLVGAYGDDDGGSGAGAAYVLLGPVTADRDLSVADAKLVGVTTGDAAGIAVAGAGDVDADGYDDVLVGASFADVGGTDAGAAYLVLGPVADLDLSAADATFVGEDGSDYAGCSVAGAGDFDGDGNADVLVGASGEDAGGSGAGAAYFLYGAFAGTIDLSTADLKFIGEVSSDGAGGAVSPAGDVDADGFDDLLVGAGGNDDGGSSAGAAYLILSDP